MSSDTLLNLYYSFNSSNYWLTFFNTPYFLRRLCDPEERLRIHPALVLAGLALATLIRSSELELGAIGRERALQFRDAAQAAADSSCAEQTLDLGLAEAAMVCSFSSRVPVLPSQY